MVCKRRPIIEILRHLNEIVTLPRDQNSPRMQLLARHRNTLRISHLIPRDNLQYIHIGCGEMLPNRYRLETEQ